MTMETDLYTINADEAGIGMGATMITDHVIVRPSGCRILEIGFGQGDLIVELGSDNEMYGVDVGWLSHEIALSKGLHERATLLWMDACTERLPFMDDFFDIVFCTETIEHMANPLFMLEQVKTKLRGDGQVVVSFPEEEDKLGYEAGKHAYVYPGLFQRNSFRRFMMQMYFVQEFYHLNGGTALYVFRNVKEEGQAHPFHVTRHNYDEAELYKGVQMEYDRGEGVAPTQSS